MGEIGGEFRGEGYGGERGMAGLRCEQPVDRFGIAHPRDAGRGGRAASNSQIDTLPNDQLGASGRGAAQTPHGHLNEDWGTIWVSRVAVTRFWSNGCTCVERRSSERDIHQLSITNPALTKTSGVRRQWPWQGDRWRRIRQFRGVRLCRGLGRRCLHP